MVIRKACVDFIGPCFIGGVKENLIGKLFINIFITLWRKTVLSFSSYSVDLWWCLYMFENILAMKYTSQTVSPHGSDVCSLLARFASAKSCYKLTAMIMCRSDGAKNEKMKKK